METAPKRENNPPEPYRRLVTDLFRKFREKPDQPKYSYAEQHVLAAESERTQSAWDKEKTEEAKRLAEEAQRKFLESKEDKKHVSTIWAPLLAAKLYLESDKTKSVSEERKKELIAKVEDLYVDLDVAREKENISDELVQKVLGVMDEIEINLK